MSGQSGAVRLAVFGASGRTGQLVLDQAKQFGYEVTAVTRRPQSMAAGDSVRIAGADIRDPKEVERAVAGCDAVLSAVSTPYSRKPIDTFSAGVSNIVEAMQRHSISRLVVVSSAVVDPGWRPSGARFFNQVVDPLILRKLGKTLYEDMERMETVVMDSGLDWTIVRPAGLFDAKSVTDYQLADESADGQYTGRPDLAAAILRQVHEKGSVHRAVGVITTDIKPSLRQLMSLWGEAFRREAR